MITMWPMIMLLLLRLRSIASYTLNVHHVIATTLLSTRGDSNHCNYCRRTTIQSSSLYSSSAAARRTKTQLYSRKSSSSTTKQQLKTIEGNDIYAAEQVIKKSRFIGLATHCTSWEDAQTIIDDIRKEHAKSRHVCFGFVSSSEGGGVRTERASDDGEPTGTGGVPILGSINGKGLSDVLVAVVRYSGGIKLGAGGLIRAYGGSATLALDTAPMQIHIPKATIRISTRAANSGAIYAAAAKYNAVTSGETYNDRGELEVTITCDEENSDQLKDAINDATSGGTQYT